MKKTTKKHKALHGDGLMYEETPFKVTKIKFKKPTILKLYFYCLLEVILS